MISRFWFLPMTAVVVMGCSTDTGHREPFQHSPAVSEEAQAPTRSESDDMFTHVIATDTEYYTIGPQQAQPPDGTLKTGTKVNVVKEAGSYCQVETEDGVVGFVVVDAVKAVQEEEGD